MSKNFWEYIEECDLNYRISKKEYDNKIQLSDLNNHVVAIDMLIYLYKYVRSVGKQWINLMSLFFYKLHKNQIRCICVFDGEDIPKDKLNKRNKRMLNIKNIEKKLEKIINIKNKLIEHSILFKETPDYIQVDILDLFFKRNVPDEWQNIDLFNINQCIKSMKISEERYKKQCTKITKEHFLINYLKNNNVLWL